MVKVKIEELNVEKFLPYGYYANCINPDTEKIGVVPIEFYRDMLQQNLGNPSRASYSVCRVEKRDPIIDIIEYHSWTEEGILPLDSDVLIHVAPATPNSVLPLEKMRVFIIPQGTLVILRPGVWHHAPFTLDNKPANVLIILPERTYANDCTVVELKKSDQIMITR